SEGSVGDLDLDVVDIVGAHIGWSIKVGSRDKAQDTGGVVDAELGSIGATNNRVGQSRCSIGVACRNGGHCRGVLCHIDGSCGAAAIGGDCRRFILVGDGARNGLGISEGTVRNLDLDVVDIVGANISWRLKIGGGNKAQDAG